MSSFSYDIEKIDRYLTGEMPPGEQEAFEAQLQQEEGYRSALAAYQRLYEGFSAARAESFRRQISDWEARLAADSEVELIDWYLNGKLQGPGLAAFEARLERDAAFSVEVNAYRQLQEGFQAVAGEAFINKIHAWEAAPQQQPALRVAARRPWLYRLAVAAAVLLVVGLALHWYAQANYTHTALVASYYQAPRSETTMGNGSQPGLSEVAQFFEQAHALFQQPDFPTSYQAFDALLNMLPMADLDSFNRQYYQEQAEWGRLLAVLAMPDPPIDAQAEAKRIAAAEGHEFQQKAAEMSRKLHSVWYRWAN
jgi:anti-sigma factor RsiW